MAELEASTLPFPDVLSSLSKASFVSISRKPKALQLKTWDEPMPCHALCLGSMEGDSLILSVLSYGQHPKVLVAKRQSDDSKQAPLQVSLSFFESLGFEMENISLSKHWPDRRTRLVERIRALVPYADLKPQEGHASGLEKTLNIKEAEQYPTEPEIQLDASGMPIEASSEDDEEKDRALKILEQL